VLEGRPAREPGTIRYDDIATLTHRPRFVQPGYTLLAHVESDVIAWVDVAGKIKKTMILKDPVGYLFDPHMWSGHKDWLHINSLDLFPNGSVTGTGLAVRWR
jgi:hypothetical protein